MLKTFYIRVRIKIAQLSMQSLNVMSWNTTSNIAGQSIFEIGHRLKHVKENDLAHGEFGKWLKKVKLRNQQAHRFMKVSEKYEDSNLTTSLNLGLNVLYQIATLPEPERTKEHITSNGETKMQY